MLGIVKKYGNDFYLIDRESEKIVAATQPFINMYLIDKEHIILGCVDYEVNDGKIELSWI